MKKRGILVATAFLSAFAIICTIVANKNNGLKAGSAVSQNKNKPVKKTVKRPIPERLTPDAAKKLAAPFPQVADGTKIITLKEIYALGKRMSKEDRLALYEWVRKSVTDRKTLFMKDEIFNQLERQDGFPPEYAAQLCDMAVDRSLDADLRGYVLQHLRSTYDKFTDEEREFVLDTFYNTLNESDNDAGGTALLSLTEFLKQGIPVDKDVVSQAAFEQAFGDNSSIPNKVTAMQCCAELGVQGTTESLKREIMNPKNPKGLKLSAVAALAKNAGDQEREFLEKLKNTDRGFYRKAIERHQR